MLLRAQAKRFTNTPLAHKHRRTRLLRRRMRRWVCERANLGNAALLRTRALHDQLIAREWSVATSCLYGWLPSRIFYGDFDTSFISRSTELLSKMLEQSSALIGQWVCARILVTGPSAFNKPFHLSITTFWQQVGCLTFTSIGDNDWSDIPLGMRKASFEGLPSDYPSISMLIPSE